jgi:SAM-dependent methyltransferase
MVIKTNWVVRASKGVWDEVFSIIEKHFQTPCVIADLGCGYHYWTMPDASFIRIDKYPPAKGGEHIEHDLNKGIPLGDKSVDYCVAVEIIEHLENPLFFLREVKRATRKLAVVTCPNGISSGWYAPDKYDSEGHITILADWLLEKHFKVIGLEIVEKRFNNNEKEIVIFLVRA